MKALYKIGGYIIAAFSAAVVTTEATAAPIYLLLEGTVSSSLSQDGQQYPSTPRCPPYVCRYDQRTGQKISVTAVWDDASMFGTDIDPSLTKGSYGNTGSYSSYTNQVDYYPLDGSHVVQIGPAPTLTINQNGSVFVHALTGPDNEPWSFTLNTEKTPTADSVNFQLKADTSDEGISATSSFELDLNLSDLSQSALDSQLLGFNWNSSQGGSANGIWLTQVYHIVPTYDLSNVSWSRIVLSHNATDVAPIPLPASLPLLFAAITGMIGLRATRKLY